MFDPMNAMRWEHGVGFSTVIVILGLFWRWSARHVKEIRIRLNGFTIEKKGERRHGS